MYYRRYGWRDDCDGTTQGQFVQNRIYQGALCGCNRFDTMIDKKKQCMWAYTLSAWVLGCVENRALGCS